MLSMMGLPKLYPVTELLVKDIVRSKSGQYYQVSNNTKVALTERLKQRAVAQIKVHLQLHGWST